MTRRRIVSQFQIALGLIALSISSASSAEMTQTGRTEREATQNGVGASGLPIPRFVSITAARVNLRKGPGRQYPIAWILLRRHLPVEVIGEFEHWRRIRDRSGEVGWVHKSMLDGKRTGMVISDSKAGELVPAYAAAGSGKTVLMAEAGAIGEITHCQDAWCAVRFERASGWMRRDNLWGVYPGEEIE